MVSARGWRPQAERLTALMRERWGTNLMAVHVHGSAALGGWTPQSDLDVLAVVRDEAEQDWERDGFGLVGIGPAPLELSVIRASAALRAQEPWPFVVHLAQAPVPRIVLGSAAAGDLDLMMHVVVARAAGKTMCGAPPTETYGVPSPERVRAYLAEELAWGLEHADERYVVLNACRAAAYARQEVVLSKVAGGQWALTDPELLGPTDAVVRRALDAQRRGVDLGPPGDVAMNLVARVRSELLR